MAFSIQVSLPSVSDVVAHEIDECVGITRVVHCSEGVDPVVDVSRLRGNVVDRNVFGYISTVAYTLSVDSSRGA
jgi:hypothetical protein